MFFVFRNSLRISLWGNCIWQFLFFFLLNLQDKGRWLGTLPPVFYFSWQENKAERNSNCCVWKWMDITTMKSVRWWHMWKEPLWNQTNKQGKEKFDKFKGIKSRVARGDACKKESSWKMTWKEVLRDRQLIKVWFAWK